MQGMPYTHFIFPTHKIFCVRPLKESSKFNTFFEEVQNSKLKLEWESKYIEAKGEERP
jgi:hypothetical protein